MNVELELVLCEEDAAWERFLLSSPQGTMYASSNLIKALNCEADFWFVQHKGVVVAGVPIITKNQAAQGLPMHSYFIGLMYENSVFSGKQNRTTEWELAISEFVMTALSTRYQKFTLCCHPSISDVRGFDWFNYHTPELGRAVISPCYTARVSLENSEMLRQSARSSRRREERYAVEREGLSVDFSGTADQLIEVYKATFVKQGSELTAAETQTTHQFAQYVIEHHLGHVVTVINQEGMIVAAGLTLYDKDTVHLPVVGVGDTQYGGTMLYFNIMDHALSQGYQYIDFNGANSPKRGYFKHSIGGVATLYFTVDWSSPQLN